jgi:transcriptional regulator with XRE-family HTH domain
MNAQLQARAIVLGAQIRLHRQRLGWSQELLAEAAGLHRTYVGAVERGERNITVLNLLRIADALKLSASALLEGV